MDMQQHHKEAEIARIKREITGIIYGSGHKITLGNGRVLVMTSLTQRPTYSRSIKELPSKSYNDSKVDYAYDRETFVLHAPRLYGDFLQTLPSGSAPSRKNEEDPFEILPGVTCIARMTSTPCAADAERENDTTPPLSSCLTFVWFQNYWAMPIASEVMEKLKAFDWEAHACNKATL